MFEPNHPKRQLRAIVALVSAIFVIHVSPSFAASSKTAKAKGEIPKATNAAGNKVVGGSLMKGTTKTTLPAAHTPKSDLVGWELMADTEWPKARGAVRAAAVNPSIRVHRSPDEFSPALTMQKGRSAFGAIAFLALGRRGDFIRVLMPLRPNGTVGWVKASDVTLDRLQYRIVIEVDRNLLTVEDSDGVIVSTKVALGTNNTPTPTGLFYVREIVPQANPNGGLGPVALGLSGLSEELRSFAGGFGRVAIHGTNAPGKLGGDVSHGCVRMDNPNIAKLARLLPLGTPVEILRTRSDQKSDAERLGSLWIDQTIIAPGNLSGLPLLTTTDATLPAAVPVAATVAPTSSTVPVSTSTAAPTTTTSTTAPTTTAPTSN